MFDFSEINDFACWIAVFINKDQATVKAVPVAVWNRQACAVWTGQDVSALPCNVENVKIVARCATVNGIACTTKDQVIVSAAKDVISAFATGERIVTSLTVNDVVAFATVDFVVAANCI